MRKRYWKWVLNKFTTCSDFRAQEEEICHDFHLFRLYLPGSNGARCHDFHLIFSFKPALSLPYHVTDHALITWLSCTDHVAIMH